MALFPGKAAPMSLLKIALTAFLAVGPSMAMAAECLAEPVWVHVDNLFVSTTLSVEVVASGIPPGTDRVTCSVHTEDNRALGTGRSFSWITGPIRTITVIVGEGNAKLAVKAKCFASP